jgi:hypothetical protein
MHVSQLTLIVAQPPVSGVSEQSLKKPRLDGGNQCSLRRKSVVGVVTHAIRRLICNEVQTIFRDA